MERVAFTMKLPPDATPVNARRPAEIADLVDPGTGPAGGFRRLEEVFRLD